MASPLGGSLLSDCYALFAGEFGEGHAEGVAEGVLGGAEDGFEEAGVGV